jgi:hypothetical protein
MLNDIRLHLDSDEDTQSQYERELAETINPLQIKNVKAFEHYVPSIGKLLGRLPFERLSVFVDQDKAVNIVDFQSGITLYGMNVDKNIEIQAKAWAYNSALIDIKNSNATPIMATNTHGKYDLKSRQNYADALQKDCKASAIDTLVLLGLGKALHITQLLQQRLGNDISAQSTNANSLNTASLKYLVIYEPDWEIFRCSLSVYDWARLLANAEQAQLQIFFRIGTDISQVFDEVTELTQQLDAHRILFYKHINLPIFTQIINCIQQGEWGQAVSQIRPNTKGHQFHHLHAFSALDANTYEPASPQNSLFKRNMALFEKYFPDIHASFKDYQPQCWQTIHNKTLDVTNLLNTEHGNFYASSRPKQEAQALAQHFIEYPNLDGLIFGYAGDKLRHYLHNTFIRKADMLLREIEESQGELPEDVKALMVFGIGHGYMLEALYEKHNIQNLIVCEPNPDFFYASLHAIDWEPIFEKVNEGKYKLYINIGEASSRLFKDLMSQFLALGPHLLNETFIMHAYQNPMMHQVISEVRQQLQVIFAMGENFDHVAYGISHTIDAMRNKVPALRYQPAQYLDHHNKQTPVFLVGNGPSLDQSIDLIKEYRDEVIVVSCGTALQALYKHGIVPDFHGEVEQNRANFDWASRINDREYLKKITLLTVNGIHPDTSSLYKNVLVAFKSGESSTHSLLAMFPRNSFHCLDHAYPTVTNMAMSFFLSLGFEQLYLIGVDLGFADQTKHHSSASGYYENGKQIYDYQSAHATDLRVKGNRQDWVFTKTEFNISRMIIEQLLQEVQADKTKCVECFNLSDGVFIEGTLPLDPQSVLVVASSAQKEQAMQGLENCFMSITSNVTEMLDKAYQRDLLHKQFTRLRKVSKAEIKTKEDLSELIQNLSSLLKSSKRIGKSLFFYYFFNSINYLSAALSKASLQSNNELAVFASKRLLMNWQVFLDDAQDMLNNQFTLIDTAEAFGDKRETFLLETCRPVTLFTQNQSINEATRSYTKSYAASALLLESSLQSLSKILSAGDVNSPIIIAVYSKADLTQYITHIGNNCELTNNPLPVGLLFNDYALLEKCQKEYSEIAKSLCLLYCSPLLETLMQNESREAVEKGAQDFVEIAQYCHFIQARGQDLKQYALIIAKPRFSCNGMQNVSVQNQSIDGNIDAKKLSTASIDMLKRPKSMVSHDEALHDSSSHGAAKQVYNNEYESLSVAYINHQIVSRLPTLAYGDAYMFKQYFAFTKKTQHKPENKTKTPLSIIDMLENRGQLMNRLPFDFELMGPWYPADKLLGESKNNS